MNYEKIKIWTREHKQQGILVASFVLVFLVGFGAGKAQENSTKKTSTQLHNTTDIRENTEIPTTEVAKETTIAQPKESQIQNIAGAECIVKGNISGKNKIYHIKGGAFYERTQAEQCFSTESEAVASGYRKSSR